MIILDANVLIYAHDIGTEQHLPTRAWLQRAFSDAESIRIPWTVVHAFLRVMTARRMARTPISISVAMDTVDEWFGSGAMSIIDPGPRYWTILRRISVEAQVSGAIFSDAHLAAIALEYDATLCTTDSDFARFPSLRLTNPLAT